MVLSAEERALHQTLVQCMVAIRAEGIVCKDRKCSDCYMNPSHGCAIAHVDSAIGEAVRLLQEQDQVPAMENMTQKFLASTGRCKH